MLLYILLVTFFYLRICLKLIYLFPAGQLEGSTRKCCTVFYGKADLEKLYCVAGELYTCALLTVSL